MSKSYIPKTFPEKCILLGGGQLMNQLMIVNVLEINEVSHPFKDKETEKVLQAKVEERKFNGNIEISEPYLLSYSLYPLKDEYKYFPLDTYIVNFDGTAKGKYTGYETKQKTKVQELNNETYRTRISKP